MEYNTFKVVTEEMNKEFYKIAGKYGQALKGPYTGDAGYALVEVGGVLVYNLVNDTDLMEKSKGDAATFCKALVRRSVLMGIALAFHWDGGSDWFYDLFTKVNPIGVARTGKAMLTAYGLTPDKQKQMLNEMANHWWKQYVPYQKDEDGMFLIMDLMSVPLELGVAIVAEHKNLDWYSEQNVV